MNASLQTCYLGILAVVLVIAGSARAQESTRPGKCYAVVVVGMAGSPVYARRFEDWADRFQKMLTKQGAEVTTVSGKDAIKEKILTTVQSVGRKTEFGDQLVLVMLGHGSLSDEKPRFVLPGEDLDAESLAKALEPAKAESQVVLNLSGSSGDFVKGLAKKGRLVITATGAEEVTEPAFAEFFLRGMESGRADGEGGAKDGTVTLLEAYNWAAHETALWISRQVEKEGEWKVDGKESVEIFHKLYDGPEGPVTPGGMRADGSRQLSAESDASKADEAVTLVVPADLKPNTAEYWKGRRVVNEHAQLEDLGKSEGISALRGETGYEAIGGKLDEEGALASRIVLGKAAKLGASK